MKIASLETKTSSELGSETETRFDSLPVNPSISGRTDFSQPKTWSKERFSMTKTTTLLIGPWISCRLFLKSNSKAWDENKRYIRKKEVKTASRSTISDGKNRQPPTAAEIMIADFED
uniref:Uncharacterized protein n=1 Tax=Cucumis sativus TaxID=3659 RepID=A0A0A0KFA8_CUCSA